MACLLLLSTHHEDEYRLQKALLKGIDVDVDIATFFVLIQEAGRGQRRSSELLSGFQ